MAPPLDTHIGIHMPGLNSALRSLARHWWVKVLIQNLIGYLPGDAGFRLNERLTGLVRGGINKRIDATTRFLKGIENLEMIQREVREFSLRGKKVLELGTGWHGIDLVIFYLLGAERILTIDHYHHLTLANMAATMGSVKDPECLNGLRKLGLAEERLASLDESLGGSSTLEELLESLSIEYRIVPSSDYRDLQLEESSIDFFYSESVLHRLPERRLRDLLQVVGGSMSPNALGFHVCDQKDIHSQSHADTQLWALNYLRYPDWFFKLFLSGKHTSQNRLRESDFLSLLQDAGMSPTFVESEYRESDIEKLKEFRVSRRFRSKSLEDLAITRSRIICEKGRSPDADLRRAITRR